MRRSFRVGLGVMAMTFVLGAARTAGAAEGSCMSRDGSCELSNEPSSFLTCDCSDGFGVGGDYGDEWEGLSDDELDALCPELLAEICGGGPATSESSTTVDPDPSATSASESDTTAGSDESGDDTTTGAEDTTDGSASATDPTSVSTTDPSATATVTDTATTDPTAGDSSGDESSDASATDASATDASADASATDPSATASATNGDDSSGTDSTAGTDEDTGGCGCRTGGDPRSAFALAVVVGIAVRRRRR